MATLIESWGGNGSNVYVGLTEANSYITNAVFDPAAWTACTTAQQQAALMEATLQIDRGTFLGGRYYSDQKLKFPRSVGGQSYTEIGSPSSTLQAQMKSDVERACCYQALFICRNSGRNTDAERIQAGISAFSESIGPVKEFVQYGAAGKGIQNAQILVQDARDLLGRWRVDPSVYRS